MYLNSSARTLSLGDDEQRVVFSIEDLCRHTIIFGSSGSGKTTRAYNPMLADMLGNLSAGAFIIAAKPEAVIEAVEIAKRAGREALVVQPGSRIGLDLLSGSPDVDAMYFRDTFGRVGEEVDLFLGDGSVLGVPEVRANEGLQFLGALDVRGHNYLP